MIPKFTWVTIFLSVFITVTVTEIVIHEYSLNKYTELTQVNSVSNDEIIKTEEVQNDVPINESIPQEPIQETQINPDQLAIPLENQISKVDETILTSAKIQDPIVKLRAFNGKIFNFIETTYNEKQVIEADIFDGEKYLGVVYEISFATPIESETAYAKIKSKAKTLENTQVNESDAFGEKSFYANNQDKQNTVFVVTKVDTTIYAFQYPHLSHTTFKSIANYLK